MELIRETLTPGQKLTEAQREEIRAASRMPITYTNDAPELTPEQLAQFRKVNTDGRERVSFTLRLPKNTLDWWRATGEDYTAAMARILDAARDYPELLKKCI
jgi:uncharacterized protein (DUF4415 family)